MSSLKPSINSLKPAELSQNMEMKIYENYRIVYRLKEGFVEIVAICHSAKSFDNIV
ncbi:MAG: hypothetical protein Q6358_10600 [Candidatus Brocadiales bacterium]|nr:hypothetical protein [Candidatus Brocadiales bacterium]